MLLKNNHIVCILLKRYYMIDKSVIGKIIKKLRKEKGFTQEQFAEKINLSTNYLSKVERGMNTPNVETFF